MLYTYNEMVDKKITILQNNNEDFSTSQIKNCEFYGYIEHSKMDEIFMDNLVTFLSNKLNKKIKICDLGIGLGKKIYYISHKLKEIDFKVEVNGIEINKNLIFELKSMRNKWKVPLIIHEEDVRTHNINKYDFIYLFQPLRHENTLPLYKNIVNNMKIGSIIFDPIFTKDSITNEKMKRYIIKNNDFTFYLWERV
jgi:hypothetical protein